jgi:hypothetical protein
MSLFDITLLQSTLAPVASGLTSALYVSPPSGLGPSQIAAYIASVTPSATASTDATGHYQAQLTQGALYLVTLSGSGFSPTYFTAATLAGGATAGAMFIPMNPSSVLCTVHGVIQGQDGTPQAGVTVTANLNASGPVFSTNLILSQTSTTTTDANGYWDLELIPNDLITTPKNTLYNFIFALPAPAPQLAPFFAYGIPVIPHGPSISRIVEVPNVASVDFATLA